MMSLKTTQIQPNAVFKKLHIFFTLLFLNFTISCTEQTEIIYPTALDLPVKYGATLKHALNGDDRAQIDIAFAYIDGDGVPKDPEKAIDWLKIAANQNNDEAQYNLGVSYFNEAKKNNDKLYYKKAYHWFLLQSEKNNKYAQYYLANLLADGYGIEKNEKESFKWFLKSSENGHATSQRNVGSAFSAGIGVNKDEGKSFSWFKKAAQNGNQDSMFFIGRYFRDGEVVTKDFVKAYQWMKLSLFLAEQSGSSNELINARKAEFKKLKSNMTKKDIKQAEIWVKRKTS